MTDKSQPNATPLPWPLRQAGRLLAPAAAGGVVVLTTSALPGETRIVLGLDVFLLSFVVLTYMLMSVSTAEKCAAMAKHMAVRHRGLIASIVTSLIGIATIAVMLHSQRQHAGWPVRALHLSGSLSALFLGWIAAQMIFGIRYMQMYYSEVPSGESARTGPDLTFPGQGSPDLWDFMYYSFTIAMFFRPLTCRSAALECDDLL